MQVLERREVCDVGVGETKPRELMQVLERG